jgi:hypothetical protein
MVSPVDEVRSFTASDNGGNRFSGLFCTVCRFFIYKCLVPKSLPYMYYLFLNITSPFRSSSAARVSCVSDWTVGDGETTLRGAGIAGFEQWDVWAVRINCEYCQVEGQARLRPGSRGTLPLWSRVVEQVQGDTRIKLDSQGGLGFVFGVSGWQIGCGRHRQSS